MQGTDPALQQVTPTATGEQREISGVTPSPNPPNGRHQAKTF